MSDTKIEWATKVWNPLRGCSKVSEGCKNCYAIKQAHRFSGEGMPFEGLTQKTAAGVNWTGKITLVHSMLEDPLGWSKPQRVFVNSMSDLFHDSVPDEYIDKVFAIMALAKQHTFMILTKRPERMAEYIKSNDSNVAWMRDQMLDSDLSYLAEDFKRQKQEEDHGGATVETLCWYEPELQWPLPNVWLGVSVENQKAADERIPLLLQTPAAIRFLSCEPLLGPVNIAPYLWDIGTWEGYEHEDHIVDEVYSSSMEDGLKWVIAGGESGHGARPMHPEWARSLRDQCQAAGVSFFFKQWGEWAPVEEVMDGFLDDNAHRLSSNTIIGLSGWGKHSEGWNGCGLSSLERQSESPLWHMKRIGKHKAGRLLDGREWNEFPEVNL